MELREIATEQRPLSVSSLTSLGKCPGFHVFSDTRFELHDPYGSEAAQTGTAVGRMIELYHRGMAFRDALEQAHAEKEAAAGSDRGGATDRRAFPLANMANAERWFHGYCDDPRNPQDIVIADLQERHVRATIPPAPEDPTGAPVVLAGHPDQVRRDSVSGVMSVWDVKSGTPAGICMLYEHAWQLSGYAVALTATLNEPVHPGGIIRVRGYGKRTAKEPGSEDVFWHAPWTLEQARGMMDVVAQHVAWLRGGLIHLHPGNHCQWCPAGSPANCERRLLERFDGGVAEDA